MLPGSVKPLAVIVDDEPGFALTPSIILQTEGFETRPFTEPREALQVLRTQTPDMLISDVVTPQFWV